MMTPKIAYILATWGLLFLESCQGLVSPQTVPKPKGCAAKPFDKKKICVLGAGGSMGSLTFGFLQRASSLYGTGMGGFRTICSCADTAKRLNSFLSKHFCLAYANESCMKITNMESVEALESRLEGWDALIMGSDMAVSRRAVTLGTYEKSPNDKCFEFYWKGPSNIVRDDDESTVVDQMMENLLQAAKGANVKHIVFVDESKGDVYSTMLAESGIPHTIIQPAGDLIRLSDYTYQKGIQGELLVSASDAASDEDVTASAYEGMSYQEDIAALCVQCLQSLDWTKSRSMTVSTAGPLVSENIQNPKRPDQQWCVNSLVLESALGGMN